MYLLFFKYLLNIYRVWNSVLLVIKKDSITLENFIIFIIFWGYIFIY